MQHAGSLWRNPDTLRLSLLNNAANLPELSALSHRFVRHDPVTNFQKETTATKETRAAAGKQKG